MPPFPKTYNFKDTAWNDTPIIQWFATWHQTGKLPDGITIEQLWEQLPLLVQLQGQFGRFIDYITKEFNLTDRQSGDEFIDTSLRHLTKNKKD